MQYDIILSEILLEFFKRLDCKERVRARIVCREWRNIIDQNRSLWRSLDFDVDVNDEAGPKALILFDEKSQSTLEDVSMYVTKVAPLPREGQEKVLKTLFDTLGKSSKTLKSAILKAEDTYQVKDRASEVLLNCLKLNTFMFFDPRYFGSNVVILQKKVYNKKPPVEGSKLQVLWTDLSSHSFLTRPSLLKNLVSLAVRWELSPSKWAEVLQASARSLKHLQISICQFAEDESAISTLSFPNLKVLEVKSIGHQKFPEWMIIPSTTILILWRCNVQENLPPLNELWLSRVHGGFKLAKCCPSLRELRIPNSWIVGTAMLF